MMNILDKINHSMDDWVDSMRASGDQGMQPRDVLQKVLAAMEHDRITGLDGKHYVPNRYEVALLLPDPAERARLLPFIGEEEMETAIQRYCQQHQYQMRGPLEVSIINDNEIVYPVNETEQAQSHAPEKVRVRCYYNVADTHNAHYAEGLAYEDQAAQPVYQESVSATPVAETAYEELPPQGWNQRPPAPAFFPPTMKETVSSQPAARTAYEDVSAPPHQSRERLSP
jgi:hypothetical protein